MGHSNENGIHRFLYAFISWCRYINLEVYEEERKYHYRHAFRSPIWLWMSVNMNSCIKQTGLKKNAICSTAITDDVAKFHVTSIRSFVRHIISWLLILQLVSTTGYVRKRFFSYGSFLKFLLSMLYRIMILELYCQISVSYFLTYYWKCCLNTDCSPLKALELSHLFGPFVVCLCTWTFVQTNYHPCVLYTLNWTEYRIGLHEPIPKDQD